MLQFDEQALGAKSLLIEACAQELFASNQRSVSPLLCANQTHFLQLKRQEKGKENQHHDCGSQNIRVVRQGITHVLKKEKKMQNEIINKLCGEAQLLSSSNSCTKWIHMYPCPTPGTFQSALWKANKEECTLWTHSTNVL
jgi:hypothetical protein